MDVEVSKEKSASIVWSEFGEFGFEGVEGVEGVVGWPVKKSEKQRACQCVNCKPKSFGGGGFLDGCGSDCVGARVNDDTSVVGGVGTGDVVGAVTA